MEKQQRNTETAEQPTLHEAQQAAAWMADYLYGDGEPAEVMSGVTEERLRTLFVDTQEATWLGRFKAIFIHLDAEQQAVAGLYVAGYPYSAIEVLAEKSVAEMLTTVRQRLALKEQRKPNLSAVRGPSAYIPLRTITDQLREPAPIDEVKLKEACQAINELEAGVFAERLRQLPQYLPAPTKDSWLRVVTEWLDGRAISELADSHGLDEHAVAAQLTRISKVFLKQYSTARTLRTLTSDELAWQEDALCNQNSGDYFFPEKGESTKMVMKICDACPVSKQCDEYGERIGDTHGILAGKGHKARRAQAKRRS